MYDLVEAIDLRRSVRKFEQKPLEESECEEIQRIIETLKPISEEEEVYLELITDGSSVYDNFGGLLDQYFKVKAPAYIAISAKKSLHYLENVGYVGEALVLELTRRKYGTCWVGNIDRDAVSDVVDLKDEYEYVITIALGMPEEEIRWEIEPERKNRKSYKTFVKGDFDADMIPIFKSIEKAPSSMNSQPWLLLAEGSDIHFYMRNTNIFTKKMLTKLNKVDVGIAMKHFESELLEIGREIKWCNLDKKKFMTASYCYTAKC
jgi:nitroreductase